jgi:type IV pilus biogenesis protein PilP
MARLDDTRVIAPAQTDTPPSPAGDTATLPEQLQMKELVLLGIFGKPDNLSALLRARDGKVLSVKQGENTPGGRVVAIGASEVHLARASGKTVRLTLVD